MRKWGWGKLCIVCTEVLFCNVLEWIVLGHAVHRCWTNNIRITFLHARGYGIVSKLGLKIGSAPVDSLFLLTGNQTRRLQTVVMHISSTAVVENTATIPGSSTKKIIKYINSVYVLPLFCQKYTAE